jgi:cyanophycinase
VIAGTSAGAAVMSAVMLTGSGNPERACGKGLGLWPGVIVDQHYLTRRRQPRLLEAVQKHPNLVGVGIDESTAVIVRGEGRRFEVVGRSQVEVLVRQPKGKAGSEVAAYRLDAGKTFDLPQ